MAGKEEAHGTIAVLELPRPAEIELSLADYPGLLAWYSTSKHPQRLVMLWTSDQAFEKHRDVLINSLNADLVWSDLVRQDARSRPPLWHRLQLHQIVLGIAALIAAALVIQGFVKDITQRPDLWLTIEESRILRLLEGTPLQETTSIRNNTNTEHRDISVEARIVGANDTFSLRVLPSGLRTLPPGNSLSLTLSGAPLPLGSYMLELSMTARAGILRGVHRRSLSVPLEVWQSEPRVEIDHVWATSEARAEIPARVYVGRAATEGLDCSFVVSGSVQPESIVVTHSRATDQNLRSGGSADKSTQRLRWRFESTVALTAKEFSILLIGHPETQWDAMKPNLGADCDAL